MTIVGYLVALIAFAADRMLKWYAQHSLPPEGVFWIPGFLGLERFENPGIAFGLRLPETVILTASVIVIVLLARHIAVSERSHRTILALAFLLPGAASNFADRFLLGYVVDYLRIGPWSLVNIADGMIIAGLLLALLRKPPDSPAERGPALWDRFPR